MGKSVGSIVKSIKSVKWIKKVYDVALYSIMKVMNQVLGVKNNKVVLVSFNGTQYGGNPKALSRMIHHARPEADIVWMFNDPDAKKGLLPSYIRTVKSRSFSALYELATAKFWIDNFCKSTNIYKGENQCYIQTWHGDRGFKKILFDSTFVSDDFRIIENEISDLFLSGSALGSKIYETAFRYKGEVLEKGSPRNDVLMRMPENKIKKIKSTIGVAADKKLLLFAPTLRREASKTKSDQEIGNIDLSEILYELKKKTGDEWVCMVRAHSAVGGLAGVPDDERFMNLSSYEDMSDLLLISDMLITDYSSCSGDFALSNRPIILFQYDRQDYMEKDRTFYFDIDSTPFMIALNQEEIIRLIREFKYENIEGNCKAILDFYGSYDTGKASEATVRYMISKGLK